MSKIIIFLIVSFIKIYKYMISPILGNRCRYMPTCSEYFQEALEVHGLIKGLRLSVKRILSCHPIKYLGGSSGIDYVPIKKKLIKEKFHG